MGKDSKRKRKRTDGKSSKKKKKKSRRHSRSASPNEHRSSRKRHKQRDTSAKDSPKTEIIKKEKPVKKEKTVQRKPTTAKKEVEEEYDIVQQLAIIKARRAAKKNQEARSKRRKRRWDAPKDKVDTERLDVQASLAKAQEVARLRLQIQQKLAAVQSTLAGRGIGGAAKQWAPLRLDEHGRQVDEKGNVIKINRSNVATLKVNKRANTTPGVANRRPVRRVGKQKHIDERMEVPSVERASRSFAFVKPGKYIRRAQTMRMKQLSKEMHSYRYEALSDVTERTQVLRVDPIPDVEWWDRFLLKTPDDAYASALDESKLTHYIYNPVPANPVCEPPPPPPMPLMLTEAEKKKIRRMRKQEKEKMRQDQIQFALISAPPPKMRLSNMARVMGDDFISGPSASEAKARAQVAARKEAHEKHNASRALTPAQKAEKHRRKLFEDTTREVNVCVFRCGDLYDGQRRFKIDINAQQYSMTGCVVLCGDCNIVVVEGGPKACKKFTRLMLHRIKWDIHELDQEEDSEEEEAASHRRRSNWNKCVLVWKGVLARRKFKAFTFEHCRSEAMGRKHFESRGVAHYWDICKNYVNAADA